MPHQLEQPNLMSIISVRRFQPVERKLHIKRLQVQGVTPFAAEAAQILLDDKRGWPDGVPPHRRIIGRWRFTPRQQLAIDRADRAISRVGRKVTVSTFPAQSAGTVRRA